MLADYTEVETGKSKDHQKLKKAIAYAKRSKVRLVVVEIGPADIPKEEDLPRDEPRWVGPTFSKWKPTAHNEMSRPTGSRHDAA